MVEAPPPLQPTLFLIYAENNHRSFERENQPNMMTFIAIIQQGVVQASYCIEEACS